MLHSAPLLGLVALAAAANALTITSPSGSSYWVQFTTNTIAWAFEPNDPSSVTIQIINPTSKQFAGPFSIAEYVPAAKRSFDVTNVTLTVADGYQVQMVNPLNNTLVLATSSPFSVKPGDTPPAPITFAPGTPGAPNSAQNSTSGAAMNGTGTSSSTNKNGNSFSNSTSPGANAKSSSSFNVVPVWSAFAVVACYIWAFAV